ELWRRIPPDALLAAAGNLDLSALVQVVEEFLTPEIRQAVRVKLERSVNAALGQDLFKDILPQLGPEWAFFIAPPAKEEKNWFPHVLFAYRVRPGDKSPPIDEIIVMGLTSLAQLAVLAHNNQPESAHAGTLSLKTVKEDKATIRYLSGSSHF